MTERIPKYVIEETHQKSWKQKAFLALLIFIIGLVAGYFSSNIYVKQSLSNLQQHNDFLEKKNQEQHSEIESLKTNMSLLQTDIKVKKEAVKQIQTELHQQLKQQDNYKSEIRFYKQLLNPEKGQKGLRVFLAQLQKQENNVFELSLSLAQKIERASTIKGKYSIEIKGYQGEKEASFSPEISEPSYQFKYFQNVSLRFSLPEGFQAQNLNVKLIPSSKPSKTVEQSFLWDDLMNKTE